MKIIRISEIDETQRRKYYRFRCSLPVRYRILESVHSDADTGFKQGVTADLSGVGMCLRLREEVNVNSILECEVVFGETKLILIGNIVRRSKTDASEDNYAIYEYEAGILFSDINDHDRDFIIKFIFEEQRRQLKIYND